MRTLRLLLLAAVLVAAEDAPLYELTPASDWEAKAPDHANVFTYLRTEFAESDPKASAEVRVMVHPLSPELAKKSLDAVARDWKGTMEVDFKDPVRVDEGASKLGEEEAWVRDVTTGWARLTWYVARRGQHLFILHVVRTYKATEDADVAKEIDSMRTSFRFLEKQEEAGPSGEPPEAEEEKLPPETLTFGHWRLECVKPEGLRKVDPKALDKSEMDSNVIAKFERTDGQSRIMVRIYAQSASSQRLTIDQLAEQKIRRFEETYDEKSRLPLKRDDRWKVPLAERAVLLELTGRRRTVEITRWLLAQCKNDRQYQVEIYVAGADPDRWSKAIDDLLKGFRPVKGQ